MKRANRSARDVLRDFRIIDGRLFQKRDAERAARWIEVHEGDRVTAGQTLAQKGKAAAPARSTRHRRRRRRIDGARLILQVADQSIDLLAKIPAR